MKLVQRALDPSRAALLGALLLGSCASGARVDDVVPVDQEPSVTDDTPRIVPDDGSILAVVDSGVGTPWDEASQATRERFSESLWEEARESLPGRADLVTYASDGLRVGGLLVRPETTEGRRLPAVIFNRDGIANEGLDEDRLLVELYRFAREGYVAAAPAYRGNRLAQGVDGFGGDDVNDVVAMQALLETLDYVDGERVFMIGVGRGGLMTYRALEEGADVRAAAVVGAPCDLYELTELRPELVDGFEENGGWPGLASLYPRWLRDRAEALDRRTPLARAHELKTPLLIAHGREDAEVPIKQAMCMASRLRAAELPFEMVVYGYGDHALADEQEDLHTRVLDWFARHGAKALLN